MSPSLIRVAVVDDSAVVRQSIVQALARDPGIVVTTTASDPIFAWGKMQREWPDVIILDIEMPRMDGLTFLRRIMSERPTPVIICSSLATAHSDAAMQALAGGAVSIITKPTLGLKDFLNNASNDIIHAVRAAARANTSAVRRHSAALPPRPPKSPSPHVPLLRPQPDNPPHWSVLGEEKPKYTADVILPAGDQPTLSVTTEKVIAIGTSTGGTQALEAVLTHLPRHVAGIVIVQHMPERFTSMFAARLNELCDIEVREAKNNDRVLPGLALIAPGGHHMLLKRSGAQYHVEVVDGPLVNRHKPSVDVLFRSVARFAGANATGVIMTGMGDDGARGLKEMHDAGASTIAQDEASCVVFGMPKEAIRLGAADRVLPLDQIAGALIG